MIIICSQCGYPTTVKKVSFKEPFQAVRCDHCGSRVAIETGTMGLGAAAEMAVRPQQAFPPSKPESADSPVPGDELEYRERDDDGEIAPPALIQKLGRPMAVIMLVIIFSFIVTVAGDIFNRLKTAEAISTARSFVGEHSEIENLIGEVASIEVARTRFVKDAGGTDRAGVELSVTGSRGSGRVLVYMERKGTAWSISAASFHDTASGTVRDLTVPGESPR